MAVRGLEADGIITVHTTRRLGFHGWSPDGNALFFQAPVGQQIPTDQTRPAARTMAEAVPSRPSSALWWIASNGGVPHPVGLERPGLSAVRISPDATRLTFTAGFDGGEVRVAERLLSR